ncbi:MAG: NAD(P)H-quinone oxidoreductase subunit 4, partial [Leptolyngbya sp. SIO4C5]|nr:NAD(P)H-quinone oxidoreductase subunit 4 [Leptolyngbya sp. SIO4C5]
SPIYLLSMLRRIFYGEPSPALAEISAQFSDIKPRESFIALCLIVPIIAIGLYPQIAIQTYNVKTVEVANRAQSALPLIADRSVPLYSQILATPQLTTAANPQMDAETVID